MMELKPCPFCGSTYDTFTLSEELSERYNIGQTETYPCLQIVNQHNILKLSCRCGCRFESEVMYSNEFVEAWNRRTKDEAD